MARIDDYQQARDLAAKDLANQSLEQIAARTGFKAESASSLAIPFLDHTYRATYPQFNFEDVLKPDTDVPLQEQVLILHYMQGCRPLVRGTWIAYREIPGAGFYWNAFVKRAIDPLKKVFGQNLEAFRLAAQKLQAKAIDNMSAGFRFDVLPYAPLQMIVWEGDDEFAAEANILFDATVGDYMSPEDAAWLASLTVYRLMAYARPN